MIKLLKSILLVSILSVGAAGATQVSEQKNTNDYMPSLLTKTPLQGRILAMTIVRKTIGTIQQNPEVKKAVRKQYEVDPQLLMYSAELVAIEFKTIAIANNYWR